ncbi:surface-adhesin E family protein [Brevundimonas sp. GCM10030266]|uniref:surface-adhesin E family protein n=1 Tax=Brevundimonas sp. GCM10030266 TaxID=3273386 RepID=UPI00360C573C
MILALLAVALFPLPEAAPQSAPQAAPPAMTQAALDVWIEQTLELDGWTVLAADQVAVALGESAGVTRDGDIVTALIRHEYYAPLEIGGYRSSSNLQRRELDCVNLRHRTLEMTLYRDNNLKEQLASRRMDDAEWQATSPNSVARTVMERACSGTRLQ